MADQPYKATIGDLKQAIIQRLDFRLYFSKHLKNPTDLRIDSPDGWSNRVLCPFHNDNSSPNFFVNLENGSFKCQACKAGGSVFDFWLMINGFSKDDKTNFKKALVGLANEAGIDIKTLQGGGISNGNKLPATATAETKKAREEASVIPKHNKADANDKTKAPIPDEKVKDNQKQLRRDHWVYLNQKRGLNKQTIEDARIGFDPQGIAKDASGNWVEGRYAIPIFDKEGKCRNIRLYSPVASADFKMINYVFAKGTDKEVRYGAPVRLYGLYELVTGQYENIVICEGEWDRLLLNQMFREGGFKTWLAVTGTHGANTFEAEWLPYFFGKNVYFCYDCDEPGRLAATDHVNKYFLKTMEKYASVHIVELPLDGSKENKDISDYFLKGNRNCEEFIQLCVETPEVIAGGMVGDDATQEAIEVEDFISAIKDRRYIDKRIITPITISGTTSKVYHAIRTYAVVSCKLAESGQDGQESCCSTLNTERTLPYGHPLFIEACMEKERHILNALAAMTCQKDQKCKVQAVAKVVMEEYFAHQVVERWKSQEDDEGRMQNVQELVHTSVYILQPEKNMTIEPQNYKATGYIRTHPKTSIATFFIESLVPMEEDWKKFEINAETTEILRTLQKDFTVGSLLEELTNGVTRIYQMDEILITVLLTYLCPLWIYFNGILQRGWINVAIIGDSGTGKSKSYQRLSDWLELGDLFSALSGTRTGLFYAIARKADEWHVKIGRYVQASGKILAADEMQEMDRSEIKKMGNAMVDGFLRVEQVASGGYHTYTRLIMLLNPKDQWGNAATVSDFTFGCDSLRMCFDPMFIRRLDLAVITTGNQKYDFYNKYVGTGKVAIADPTKREMTLTPRMMRTLIYWAWTRRADNIIWSEEATKGALEIATQMSIIYGDDDDVPLVNPQDFREKLARLASAYAILDRNFTPDFQGVRVELVHVQFVANFLDRLYSTPACNLKQKSKAVRKKKFLDDFDRIKEAFESAIRASRTSQNEMRRQGDYLVRFLATIHGMTSFRKRELAEQLNVNVMWVTKRIMIMQGYDLIDVARHGGYKITRKFNLFMQRWTQDPEIEKMFSDVQDKIGKQALEQADSLDPYEKTYQGRPEEHYESDPFTE